MMFLGFFQWGCLYGPIFSSIQDLAPEKNKALVVAYYLFLTNFIGIGLSTTAAGIMTDILIANNVLRHTHNIPDTCCIMFTGILFSWECK